MASNKVASIEPLIALQQIEVLDLSKNQLPSLNLALLKLSGLVELKLEHNQLINLPSEITNLENCLEDARTWFQDLEKGSVQNYDLKLIIAGNGRVGKTSVLKRMFFNEFDPKENSTHGIQLYSKEIFLDDIQKTLKINTWDFGGQEVYHATHRLFMQSRALHLVIWDFSTEHKKFAQEYIDGKLEQFRNFKIPYWLDHARSLSWQSPLLVVQNKMDEHGRKLPDNWNDLQKRYDIINHLHVSAQTGRGFTILTPAIIEELRNMPEFGMKTPASWMRIKEKLVGLKQDHQTIPYQVYQDLCVEEGLNNTSIEVLIRFLHNTGNLFYQKDLFQNRIILDQAWALEGLYAILQRGPFYNQLMFAKGRTSLSALALPWQQYDILTRKIFISMMESCEICFKITDDEIDPQYIITQYLPKEKDEKVKDFWKNPNKEELFLHYKTPFFHPAFISRFIARAGRLAENFDYMWRDGIWITLDNTHALIEAFPESHQVVVRAKGAIAGWLVYLIHKEFNEIFYNPDSIKMEISKGGETSLTYQELKEGKKQGHKQIISQTKHMVDLDNVAFFEDVLEAKSEEEAKRKLKYYVPKPIVKKDFEEPTFGPDQLKQLKKIFKDWLSKELETALTDINNSLIDCSLKNKLILIQSRFNDLKEFRMSGEINFEPYALERAKIIHSLIDLIDQITEADLYLEEAVRHL